MSRWTDHAENKLVDFMRGQGLTLPANWHIGIASAAGANRSAPGDGV